MHIMLHSGGGLTCMLQYGQCWLLHALTLHIQATLCPAGAACSLQKLCRSFARGADGKPLNKRFSPAEIKAKYTGNPKYAGVSDQTLDVSGAS